MKRKPIVASIVFIIIIASVASAIYFHFFFRINPYHDAINIGIIDSGMPYSEINPGMTLKTFVNTNYGYAANESVYDLNGHGSHVYYSLVNTLSDRQIVRITSAKIIDDNGYGHFSALKDAITWLKTQNVDIIVFSGGSPNRAEFVSMDIFKQIVLQGTAVVIAAGNSGSDAYQHGSISFPANLPYTLAVGALNETGQRATYSSVGKNENGIDAIDVSDDGTALESGGAKGQEFGTSFAAPKVAAKMAEALYYAHHKSYDLRVSDLYALVMSSGNPVYSPDIGFGVPSITKMKSAIDAKTPFVVIKAGNEFSYHDSYIRYAFEKWNETYLVYAFGEQLPDAYLYRDLFFGTTRDMTPTLIPNDFPTNNSLNSIRFEIVIPQLYLMTLKFTGSGINGTHRISFESQGTPILTHDFKTYFYGKDVFPIAKMLVDLSGMNDLSFGEYGVTTDSVYYLRGNGYQVTFTHDLSGYNLSSYDVVFSPNFEEKWYDGYQDPADDLSYSLYHPNQLPMLMKYLENGGNWIITLGYSSFFQYDQPNNFKFKDLYSELNISVTELSDRLTSGSYALSEQLTSYYENYGWGVAPNGTNTKTLFQIESESLGNVSTSIYGKFGAGQYIVIGDTTPFIQTNQVFLLSALADCLEGFSAPA